MRKIFNILLLLLIVCQYKAEAANSRREIVQGYIEQYKHIAIDEMRRTNIPASIKMAQAILESNAGQSYLATNANNHFGIKCGKYWGGGTAFREDDDYDKRGKLKKSCFRAYVSPSVSFVAHSEFLMDSRKAYRYGFLFNYDRTDFKSWAHGLKKAGYATNPKYPSLLLSIIETYQLHLLDDLNYNSVIAKNEEIIVAEVEKIEEAKETVVESTQVVVVEPKKEVKKPKRSGSLFSGVAKSYRVLYRNKIPYISTDENDMLSDIALELGIGITDLIKFNDFQYSANKYIAKNMPVYLDSKASKSNAGRKYHYVEDGDTWLSIAQEYAIQRSKLLKRNRVVSANTSLKVGQKIYLKGKAKKKR